MNVEVSTEVIRTPNGYCPIPKRPVRGFKDDFTPSQALKDEFRIRVEEKYPRGLGVAKGWKNSYFSPIKKGGGTVEKLEAQAEAAWEDLRKDVETYVEKREREDGQEMLDRWMGVLIEMAHFIPPCDKNEHVEYWSRLLRSTADYVNPVKNNTHLVGRDEEASLSQSYIELALCQIYDDELKREAVTAIFVAERVTNDRKKEVRERVSMKKREAERKVDEEINRREREAYSQLERRRERKAAETRAHRMRGGRDPVFLSELRRFENWDLDSDDEGGEAPAISAEGEEEEEEEEEEEGREEKEREELLAEMKEMEEWEERLEMKEMEREEVRAKLVEKEKMRREEERREEQVREAVKYEKEEKERMAR